MHGKGDFWKIKESICNIPVEATSIPTFYQGQKYQMN